MITDESFAEIRTERLLIRRFRPADAPRLADYRNDPAVSRFQTWPTPFSEADATVFIRDMLERHPGRPGQWFQFAISLNDGDELIGDCAVCCSTVPPPVAEFGCTLSPPFQGHGYAREALGAVSAYAFRTLGAERVLGVTDRRNRAARRLMQSMGWREGDGEGLVPPSGPLRDDETLYVLSIDGLPRSPLSGDR